MFDIGFTELVLVFVIALLVLGPERLPQVARTMGHWVGRARAAFNHLRQELEAEAYNQEMREKFRKQMEEMGITEEDLRSGKADLMPPSEEAYGSSEEEHTNTQPNETADTTDPDKDSHS